MRWSELIRFVQTHVFDEYVSNFMTKIKYFASWTVWTSWLQTSSRRAGMDAIAAQLLSKTHIFFRGEPLLRPVKVNTTQQSMRDWNFIKFMSMELSASTHRYNS